MQTPISFTGFYIQRPKISLHRYLSKKAFSAGMGNITYATAMSSKVLKAPLGRPERIWNI
jgi:hypothetical protein